VKIYAETGGMRGTFATRIDLGCIEDVFSTADQVI